MNDDRSPIDVNYEWSEPLVREATAIAQQSIAPKGKFSSMLAGIAIAIMAMLLMASLFPEERGPMVGLFIGYLMATILTAWTHKRGISRYVASESAAPTRTGNTAVTLDAAGIHGRHALHQTFLKWGGITELREGKIALHAMFGPHYTLPFPDSGLPEGMTRDVLRQRMEAWRSASSLHRGVDADIRDQQDDRIDDDGPGLQ